MLDEMRQLALADLNRRCSGADTPLEHLRQTHADEIAHLLVEDPSKVPRVYLLQQVPEQPGAVRLWSEQLDARKSRRLPFNKPSGAQSAAIGPVFKRTYKKTERPPYGPTLKIQNTTREAFRTLAQAGEAWSDYFTEVHELLFASHTLLYNDQSYPVGPDQDDPHILAAAARRIDEKETVFLSVVDSQNRWPGERAEYQAYLAQQLAQIKYVTGEAAPYTPADCPLCGKTATTLYPNALKGAGLNLSNMDREGAFPALDTAQAWKSYGLCLDCADLLYIFKNHLLNQFLGRIAGERALLLPGLPGQAASRQAFIRAWHGYVQNLEGKSIKSHETDLLEFFSEQGDAQLVLHILWANFGQVLDEVRGYVTDILPSRLQALVRLNQQANGWPHALAPRHAVVESRFDLALSMLGGLFKRPGGKRAEKSNDSAQLFGLKQQLAEAIYHGQPLGEAQASLWRELLLTARWWLDDTSRRGNAWGLLHEGISDKGVRFLTPAGWIRHLARFLYYLHHAGVLPDMESNHFTFEPAMEKLRPYFEPGSGLNRPEKAFAFLLGILYGKLLEVQSARGVNVAANALTWLKRLNLDGNDLPILYNKIREKLLSYGTEANADVRGLIHELGRLGARLGDRIQLDNHSTCYFLLLGQSITIDILPSKARQSESTS